MSSCYSAKILELLKFAYIENGDGHVTPADVERFLDDKITMRYIKKNDPIVSVGTELTSINLVLTGSFSLIRQGRTGRSVAFSRVNCPELIGCTQLFSDDSQYYSDIVATSDCWSIDIDCDVFHEAVLAQSETALVIITHLCRKLQGSHSRIDRFATHDSTDNLIIFLYHRWLERTSRSEVFKISDKHKLIAMELGVSVRTLYRSINKLRDRDMLSVADGGVLTMTSAQIECIYSAYNKLMLPEEQTLHLTVSVDRFKTEELKRRFS